MEIVPKKKKKKYIYIYSCVDMESGSSDWSAAKPAQMQYTSALIECMYSHTHTHTHARTHTFPRACVGVFLCLLMASCCSVAEV